MLGENCRSGCRTRNHQSYIECMRDGTPRVTLQATPHNSWDKELSEYAEARRQGVQPAGTSLRQTRAAMEISEASGSAFDASGALR